MTRLLPDGCLKCLFDRHDAFPVTQERPGKPGQCAGNACLGHIASGVAILTCTSPMIVTPLRSINYDAFSRFTQPVFDHQLLGRQR